MKPLYKLILLITAVPFLLSANMLSRGAKNEKELSDRLFHAIKVNDFDLLENYLPKQDEIKWLQQNCSETNKLLFNSLTSEKVRSEAEQGFNDVIREGIANTINWQSVSLVDYKTTSCSIDEIGCNVTFTIEDQKGDHVVVSYDAVKADDRWFLLQNFEVID